MSKSPAGANRAARSRNADNSIVNANGSFIGDNANVNEFFNASRESDFRSRRNQRLQQDKALNAAQEQMRAIINSWNDNKIIRKIDVGNLTFSGGSLLSELQTEVGANVAFYSRDFDQDKRSTIRLFNDIVNGDVKVGDTIRNSRYVEVEKAPRGAAGRNLLINSPTKEIQIKYNFTPNKRILQQSAGQFVLDKDKGLRIRRINRTSNNYIEIEVDVE